MRATLALCAVALLTAGVSAQTFTGNRYQTWDKTTEYTSRGGNATSSGFVSQGYSVAHIGGATGVRTTQYALQDQEASTREPYDFGFCSMAATGLPDYTSGTNYATNFLLPAGNGIQAWLITWNFPTTTPVALPQNCEETHHYWEFVQTSNWTSDGIGVHMSQAGPQMLGNPTNSEICYFYSAYNRTVHREIPRTDPAHPVNQGNRQIVEQLGMSEGNPGPANWLNRSWHNDMGLVEPSLTGGAKNKAYNGPNATNFCFDPNPGYMALDPDFNDLGAKTPIRLDDYVFTLNSDFGNFGFLLLSNQMICPGAPTAFGKLMINPADTLFGILNVVAMGPISGGTVSTGLLGGNLGSQNSLARQIMSKMLNVHAQAIAADLNTRGAMRLSNVWTFRGSLDGRAKSTDASGFAKRGETGANSNTKTESKAITDNRIWVRNDGHTVLTVQPQLNGTPRGPATNVPVRGMVVVLTAPGTNQLKFTFRGNGPNTGTGPLQGESYTWSSTAFPF